MDPAQENDFAKNLRRYREFVEKTGYVQITGNGKPMEEWVQ